MTIKVKRAPSGFQTEVTMGERLREQVRRWAAAMRGFGRTAPDEAAKAFAAFVDGLGYRRIAPVVEALGWTPKEAKRALPARTHYRLYGWRRVREGIDALCDIAGSNHTELANLLGVDDAQMSRWYNGKSEPNPKHRERLESALAAAGLLREGERLW